MKPLTLALSLLVTGCAVGPDFVPPTPPATDRYTTESLPSLTVPAHAAGAAPDSHAGDDAAASSSIPDQWWSIFHSSTLDDTVQVALDGNRDLKAAQASLLRARELLGASRAARLPEATAEASNGRQKLGAAFLGGFNLPPFTYYSVGVSVSYLLDFAGGVRRTVEEQQALAEVQQHELDAAHLALTGNVVLQALAIASARAQIEAAEGILEEDRRNVELVKKAFEEGSVPRLDVLSAQSQLAQDETLMPPLRQELSTARHALAVLVGEAPGNWSPPDFELDALVLPTTLPLNLPSELAHRRPDIRAGEAQLHAATAAVGIATANLYPQLRLSGSLSQQAITVGSLFDGENTAFSLAGNLAAPLFDSGKRRAERRAAEAAMQASLAKYEQTVLNAFRQVADVLAALEHDAQQIEAQQRALDVAESGLALTRESYQAGNVGVLQILDAERQVQRARVGAARARAQRLQDAAELIVALGGGTPLTQADTRTAGGG